MSKTIVIVIQEGETHTFYSDRCVLADVERALETPPEVKSEIDSMLADFQKDFGCEANLTAKPRRRRHAPVKNEKLEEIKLGEYRRLGKGRKFK